MVAPLVVNRPGYTLLKSSGLNQIENSCLYSLIPTYLLGYIVSLERERVNSFFYLVGALFYNALVVHAHTFIRNSKRTG